MLNLNKTLIFFTLSFLFSLNLSANKNDNHWELIKEDNGVRVYTAESSQSNIVKARAIATMNAPLNKVRSILDDIEHRYEWVPYLIISKSLSDYNHINNPRIEYSHFHAPWPASDRDFVYEIQLISTSDKQLVYKMKSVVSELMPINKQIIRAELLETIYTLTALDNATTKVEIIFHADPKGWIPDWIVNIIQSVLPYKILINLNARLKQ